MRRRLRFISMGLCLFGMLCGCTATDPLYQTGRWNPTGDNDYNLAAEIENPADLLSGRQAQGTSALDAAAAVDRLRRDQVKALPDSGISEIKIMPNGGGSSDTGSGVVGAGGL